MKEDYLWNKTGSDTEIERLENALKAFRYQEAAPPVLPAKIIPFEKKSPRGFFRFSLAFGAFAALAIVCFGVWSLLSKRNVEVGEISTPVVAPSNFSATENAPTKTEIETPKNLRTEKAAETTKIESPQNKTKNQFVKTVFISPAKRRNNLTARNGEIKTRENSTDQIPAVQKPAVKLTEEETYAYSQLMRALSITGSQLKLVKDKIDAVENSR